MRALVAFGSEAEVLPAGSTASTTVLPFGAGANAISAFAGLHRLLGLHGWERLPDIFGLGAAAQAHDSEAGPHRGGACGRRRERVMSPETGRGGPEQSWPSEHVLEALLADEVVTQRALSIALAINGMAPRARGGLRDRSARSS